MKKFSLLQKLSLLIVVLGVFSLSTSVDATKRKRQDENDENIKINPVYKKRKLNRFDNNALGRKINAFQGVLNCLLLAEGGIKNAHNLDEILSAVNVILAYLNKTDYKFENVKIVENFLQSLVFHVNGAYLNLGFGGTKGTTFNACAITLNEIFSKLKSPKNIVIDNDCGILVFTTEVDESFNQALCTEKIKNCINVLHMLHECNYAILKDVLISNPVERCEAACALLEAIKNLKHFLRDIEDNYFGEITFVQDYVINWVKMLNESPVFPLVGLEEQSTFENVINEEITIVGDGNPMLIEFGAAFETIFKKLNIKGRVQEDMDNRGYLIYKKA